MTTDVNDLLLAGGVPAAKFPAVGTAVWGDVIATEVRDQTDMKTGEVKTFTDGRPMKQIVVTLQTEQRDPEMPDDDGQRRIFVKGQMLKVVRDAVRPHGGIQIGGKLYVKFVGEEPPTTRGFSPTKLYEARYQPPVAPAVSLEEKALPF